ncbi:hypothetical protein BKA70DRAFT_642140 [Coprinopsis sp. MPI-PUGE-AT-0042]|nr:hypothetical protein BKA70DRAFT_642140 [Coprinopsis sp. MPI-PUGE-AT-0042]
MAFRHAIYSSGAQSLSCPDYIPTSFPPLSSRKAPCWHRERRQWSCVLPESAKEAAPTVVKGLLHAFVNKLASRTKTRGLGAPWWFTTEDTFLAAAIGHELRRVGVHPDALCNIGIANRPTISNAQEAFRNYFEARKSDLGLQGHTAAMVNTPGSITFDYTVPPWSDSALCLGLESGLTDEMRYINKLLAYFRHRSGGIPSNGEDYDSEASRARSLAKCQF